MASNEEDGGLVMRLGRTSALLMLLGSAAIGTTTLGGTAAVAADTAQVRFAESSLQAVEDRGPVRVRVERVDLPVSRLLVHYRTEEVESSASTGPDYAHTAGTLVFDVGVQSNVFTVFLRDDEVAEETEYLLLHLETSSGTGASSRLTIIDDDPVPAAAAPAPATPAVRAANPASAPVVVASSAGSSRPVVVAAPRAAARSRVVTEPPRRRIILEQTTTTPFELRPVPGSLESAGGSTAVDPLLALAAGLLLARVAAEAWFRARIAIA